MTRAWPDIPFLAWKDTCATLQLWVQIVGKYRLARTPWVNHSWHATLYVTPRGLTTSPIPAEDRSVEFEFDFVEHKLNGSVSDGSRRSFALEPMTVAQFHARFLALTDALGVRAKFSGTPNEVADAIPFAQDTTHASYDADAVARFWRALVEADRVLKIFRTGFLGKVSPVHLFWGSFDLAVTRFSGRSCAAASGRHPGAARCGDARGLFARGELRRLLARRRAGRLRGLLLLRLSRAAGLRAAEGDARRCVLSRDGRRVHPPLRCRAHRRRSGPGAARLPRVRPTMRRRASAIGTARHSSAPAAAPACRGRCEPPRT